jgi:hypothetical protein
MSHKEKSRRKLHGMKMKVTVEVPFRRKRYQNKGEEEENLDVEEEPGIDTSGGEDNEE